MFLTCSIRRKLFVQFSLVFAMLLIMATAAIVGLVSYRRVVSDLEYSINDAPRKADLVASIDILFEPLSMQPPDNAQHEPEVFAAAQHTQFRMALERSKQGIREFLLRLDELPEESIPPETYALLRMNVINTIAFMDENLPRIIDPRQRGEAASKMLSRLVALHQYVNSVPDPFEVFVPRLAEAERNLQFCLNIVIISSVITFLLFLAVVGSSNHWIFEPIKKLHKAARRVANGDFQYRADLKTGDEMSDLAEVFNQVTSQFYEMNQDLDRKVREKTTALIRSERLAGVGFLASGVAHEINNPLHVIATIADSLEMQSMTVLADAPEADREVFMKYLGMIQTESFRCQEITEKLLSFARGQEVSRSETDLTTLSREVVSMVSHLGKFRDRNISVLTEESIFAEVNASEIKQVVLNMVSNALEAMDSGGKLEIELSQLKCHAYITFRDDGCGMTQEVQEHLFDPFFTQRKGGGGTGLGLSISHRIVEDHNGAIQVKSDGPGKGTTFRIRLPKKVQQTSLEETSHEDSTYFAA
ncbi:MAG: ATP-binding protein [Rubinisphaera brasiliensis]|uniref:sensor histidine kinase n=1 Tax=Rubinisphaera TaxID=1649490 RepID=UPI001F1ADB6C|nr:ATP-binding protein [Rubinisphaera sp. JC750]